MIYLNGEPRLIQDGATVAMLLDTLDVHEVGRGIAVAVDAEVVPRSRWAEHVLGPGARVEIVSAIQGG